MMNAPRDDQKSLLPILTATANINSKENGNWYEDSALSFSELASSLYCKELSNSERTVSSIPDAWARPLLMDIALQNEKHPLHQNFKDQWKGMLAAVALANLNGFPITAEVLDFNNFQDDDFILSLLSLIPSARKSVYTLEKNRNPWELIYIFLWEKTPVGMTSPLTLLCPSEGGIWSRLPWYYDGRLQSPIATKKNSDGSSRVIDTLNLDEKNQLWAWLKKLVQEVSGPRANQSQVLIKQLADDFQRDILNSGGSKGSQLRVPTTQNYFGIPITLGNISTLNEPIGIGNKESSLKLLYSEIEGAENVLFIPDVEKLKEQWCGASANNKKEEKDIWVDRASLLNFDPDDFRRTYKGEYLTEQDLFLNDFFFLKGTHKLLPGAVLPKGHEITYRSNYGDEIELTPLLPINQKLLEYFDSERLSEMVEIKPTKIQSGDGVIFSIKLPLSDGVYEASKEYKIDEEKAIEIRNNPYVEIWPNFVKKGWNEYYALYYDNRSDNKAATFNISFPNEKYVHRPENLKFAVFKLNSFPPYFICRANAGNIQGIVLLAPPPSPASKVPNKVWTVGVDFGTSFTNVWYKYNQTIAPLSISPMLLQVTESGLRTEILYENFISPERENFPISTVLTIKGMRGNVGAAEVEPVIDGRIYHIRNLQLFEPQREEIRIGLKWLTSEIHNNGLFLRHLALLISAEAARNDVAQINWAISYPSSFSRADRSTYWSTWGTIINNYLEGTGIRHSLSYKQTESIALAQYFADYYQNEDLSLTTCIDMGGGSSDISVWAGNKLLHQCSVQLAGQLLFSQFAKQKADFIGEKLKIDFAQLAQQNTARGMTDPFYVKLDAALLTEGERWLKNFRTLEDSNPDLQYIVTNSTLGIAGLYYYIGVILRGLTLKDKYKQEQITPVFVGGNGSRILNWLSSSGIFTSDGDAARLFSRMLSVGSGFQDTREQTIISSNPKAEAACGLVLDRNQTRLTGLDEEDEDGCVPFAGEDCYVNGQLIGDDEPLTLPQRVDEFSLEEDDDEEGSIKMTNLKSFVDEFHQGISDLRIKDIKPLSMYADDDKVSLTRRSDLWKKVRRNVKNSLINLKGLNTDIRVEPPFIIELKALLEVLRTFEAGVKNEDQNY